MTLPMQNQQSQDNNPHSVNPSSNRINAPQALFGTLMGVWYSSITKNIVEASSLPEGFPLSLQVTKTAYIIASLFFLLVFIRYFINYQEIINQFPERFNGDFSFPQFLKENQRIIFYFCLAVIPLSASLLTTGLVFRSQVSMFYVIFGMLQPWVWLFLDTQICWSSYKSTEWDNR